MEHSSNKGIILILSILFIVVMMIPITGLIIAPSDIDWLEQPRYELGGMTLNEIFVDNAQYLETGQLVENGDFSDGTTGWEISNSTYITNISNRLNYNSQDGTFYYFRQIIENISGSDNFYISLDANIEFGSIKYGYDSAYGNLVSRGIVTSSGNVSNIINLQPSSHDYTYITFGRNIIGEKTVFSIDDIMLFNISTLITNNQYSPLSDSYFNVMSDADIKAQMDLWVTEGLDILNIWLTYNAVGLDHILSYDEMLDYYQLYLSYL